MERVALGRTGLRLSRVGFGCAAIGGYDYGPVDDRESIAAVEAAIDAGVTFFDTADVYGLGHAEEILGQALRGRGQNVIVGTKFGVSWDAAGRTARDASPARVVTALDASLRRLKVDCIPLYQIHWPDPATPIGETMVALERCRELGKVLHVGCCNFPLDLVEAAQEAGRLESVQVPYSIGQQEWANVAQTCAERYDMAVLCYNPLAQGLFSGKYSRASVFGAGDLRSRSELFLGHRFELGLVILERLRVVANRLGRTPAQVALRWVLQQPGVASAITGAKRASHILENVQACGWCLNDVDLRFLTQG